MVEHSSLVSSNPGYARGLPSAVSQSARSSESTNRTGVNNAPMDAMRSSKASPEMPCDVKEFLKWAMQSLEELLHPAELKRTRATIPCAQSGLLGVSQRIQIPLMDL